MWPGRLGFKVSCCGPNSMSDRDEDVGVLELLDELRILAKNGLEYADNVYDADRYERILELVEQQYGTISGLPVPVVRERFRDEVGHVTPKVGGRAAIFDDDGHILVMKRADDGTWCLPSGFVDPGESPEEAAVRETKEETGLDVRPVELVDLYTRYPSAEYGPHTLVAATYLCAVTGGELSGSHEDEGLAYQPVDDVSPWHKDHEGCAREALELHRER